MRIMSLSLLLCCMIFPVYGKDAGWQWYNEKMKQPEPENKPVTAAPRRQAPDIMKPFCIPAWTILSGISGCRITGRSRPGFSP